MYLAFMEIRRKGLALVGGVTVWFYKAGHHSQPAGGEQQTQLTIYEHTEPLVLDGRRDEKGRRGLYQLPSGSPIVTIQTLCFAPLL